MHWVNEDFSVQRYGTVSWWLCDVCCCCELHNVVCLMLACIQESWLYHLLHSVMMLLSIVTVVVLLICHTFIFFAFLSGSFCIIIIDSCRFSVFMFIYCHTETFTLWVLFVTRVQEVLGLNF